MIYNNVLLAFILTLCAGLCTGIGGLIGIITKKTNTTFLSVSLGFSAGVMLYVSFVEILPKAFESLTEEMGNVAGSWTAVGAFFIGVLFIMCIDKLLPKDKTIDEPLQNNNKNNNKLLKTGILTALAIGIHNFPEGLITFTATLQDPSLGIAIAFAIAIHNIPEGIAVSVPIYYATGSKKKAFWYSFLSGLAEPIGALLGFLVLMNIYSDIVFGMAFAFVAGIMVIITIEDLLPAAREYGKGKLTILGFVSGMAVMALSLLLFIN